MPDTPLSSVRGAHSGGISYRGARVAEDVAALQAVLPKDRGITFLTGSLEQSIMAIASARVALTMDSGPAFFAKALGVTAVALFGASDPLPT